MNFTPKRAAEVEVFTVDFANLMASGETILTAVWTNAVQAGRDPQAAAMLIGTATIAGSTVSQLIRLGVAGVTYTPICTVHTSIGQVLVLPDPGAGLLTVTA